jgi:hypothetical protein
MKKSHIEHMEGKVRSDEQRTEVITAWRADLGEPADVKALAARRRRNRRTRSTRENTGTFQRWSTNHSQTSLLMAQRSAPERYLKLRDQHGGRAAAPPTGR